MKPVDKITRLRFRCLTVAGIEVLLLAAVLVFLPLLQIGVFGSLKWSDIVFAVSLILVVFFIAYGVLILLSVSFPKMYHVLAVLTFFVFGSITVLLTSFGARPSYLLIWGGISLAFLLPHLIYEIAWFRRPARISTLESEKEGSSL